MPSATQIIEQALGELGVKAVGQPTSGDELQDCFDRLNALVDAWRGQNLYAYTRATVTATLPANTVSAVIGTGQLFNIERPFRLETGSYYRLSGLDFPITEITFAEYQAIGLKTQPSAGPVSVYYSPDVPNGTLFFWPTAAQATSVTIACLTRLSEFANLTTLYTLPPGYQRALFLSLAEELSGPYEADLSVRLARNAASARRIIKRANVEIPVMSLDSRIPGRGNAFNYRTGL